MISEGLTDKVSHHRYDRYYPIFLENLRNLKFNMLEIGIYEGGSLALWEKYFPFADIYGVDKNHEWRSERCKTFKLDQSKLSDLKIIVSEIPQCRLIIDDGSHHPVHQFNTFLELFQNLLLNGGVYIIEDIECNYWRPETNTYGYPIGHFNIIDYMKPSRSHPEFTGRNNYLNISSITFAHNCVIIIKQTDEEIELSKRTYKHESLL